MNSEDLKKIFDDFRKTYNEEDKIAIWKGHNQTFRDFWNNKILNPQLEELNESEVDQIIRILDRNAKGNTRRDEAVAKAMIPQGVWRRMFREIKVDKRLQGLLNDIFNAPYDNKQAQLIDELYKFNEGRKNSLTGKNANAINAMLCAFDANKYIHIISLNDRKKVIEYFNFYGGPNFDTSTPGQKLVLSNKALIDGFRQLEVVGWIRTISKCLYSLPMKEYWRAVGGGDISIQEDEEEESIKSEERPDIALFYMESQLEDFLIENWDKTELGKEYDLIEENGEIVSQQYPTDIGNIDILAQDKKTKQYVVVELKKNPITRKLILKMAQREQNDESNIRNNPLSG